MDDRNMARNIAPNQNEIENSFIDEICEALGIEELGDESYTIAKHLLINGRQSLVEYRSYITPIDFNSQMKNDGSSELLEILKRYFLQQWQQIPFDWFKTFINQQQSEDEHESYEHVLLRTAEYGSKFLKTCPVFSMVLQIVFDFDDETIAEENIFNNIWNSFIIDGYNVALEQSDKYLVPAVKKKYINAFDSSLFRALREYFREPMMTLLKQSRINNRRNLLEITLDCLAKFGWKGGLEDSSVTDLIAEIHYKVLLSQRNQYLEQEELLHLITQSSSTTNTADFVRTENNSQNAANANMMKTVPAAEPPQSKAYKLINTRPPNPAVLKSSMQIEPAGATDYGRSNYIQNNESVQPKNFRETDASTASTLMNNLMLDDTSASISTSAFENNGTPNIYPDVYATSDVANAVDEDSTALVYIPYLPTDISNTDLEETIRSRLQDSYNVQVLKVQCFSDIGVGIVHLRSQREKNYLVNKLQTIILFPKDRIQINFVEELEIVCYLVFDVKQLLLTNEMIAKRWMNLFESKRPPRIETLSMQFSNIIKVTLFSIDEVQSALQQRIISVDEEVARICIRVDCSYLEELPRSKPKINADHLFCHIATQLDMNDRLQTDRKYCQQQADLLFQQMSSLPSEMKKLKSLFHIQYNEESSNAVILASSTVHKWLLMKFVNIKNELIFKTANISCKLIIKPIPPDFPHAKIFNHKIFQNSVKINDYKRIGENLVVEVTDPCVYDKCLNIRVIELTHNDDLMRLHIVPYTAIVDPEGTDINDENWYSTRMLDHKPDIAQFDPRHPVFRYKWNSKIWSEQFKQVTEQFAKTTDTTERRKLDMFRRMLRVTVMLKTIEVMRKSKYDLEDSATKTEIMIQSPSPLVTIVYNHQSMLAKSSEINNRLPPFDSTTVRVINEDCLISYDKLMSSGLKPLLLNMANASTPGGGYRKGDGAQEENLFRRSNYYLSLDPTLDHQQDQLTNCQWYQCSSATKLELLDINKSFYPMDEYGGIYTSGITVLRGTEETGYPFLSKPLYDVCSLAIAAYRNPPVHDNNRLALKFAIGTRKKIENLFSIAYKHGHHSLVLSALGCGAFKNPPEHIALIFKSVITQYAGFFKRIDFSIIDDHNTGHQMNPNGNFMPFQNVLNDLVVRPSANPTVGMAVGPYYLIESRSKGNAVGFDQVSILGLPLCEYASQCRDLYHPQHRQSYAHPPLCPMGSECTDTENNVHLESFSHRIECSEGGLCSKWDDQRHMTDYLHPGLCTEGGYCTNMKTSHLTKFRHVSICRDGLECQLNLRMVREHQVRFRHCQRPCSFGGNCIRFHDEGHIKQESHPFKTPCHHTPFSCALYVEYLQSSSVHEDYNTNRKEFKEIENHCLLHSHVCPWGRLCIDTTVKHLSTTIHIARKMCPDGDNLCPYQTDEDHLESFSHTGVRDIRLECRYSAAECQDLKKPAHMIKYRHNYRQDFLGVAEYSGLNQAIDFVFNQSEMTRILQNYFETTHKIKWSHISIPNNLLNWIAALQPVHRCSANIFESILVHGHVMSRAHMERLKEEKFVAHTANQHNSIRKIVSRHVLAVQANVQDFIAALVEMEFSKSGSKIGYTSHRDEASRRYRIDSKEQAIKIALKSEEIDDIRRCAIQVAQASITLHSNKTGIGHQPDVELGTNQHVFAILGPHTGHYYGDIVIIFKRDIMLHPDSNFTMQAATTYTSGKAYKFRPWLKDSGTIEGHLKQFHGTKLHCSVPGYESVTALELIAITGGQKYPMKADLRNIIQRWMNTDSHQVIETHLPQLIPLSYVDYIYMPKNVFNLLSSDAQNNAKNMFGPKLTVTDHVVDLTVELLAFSNPDDSRVEYHKYILEKITGFIRRQEQTISIEQQLKNYGMTFTLPASNFKTHVINPMTISQSHSRYVSLSNNRSTSDDYVYIYWKAIGGDFMLILTDERIQPNKVQQNLIYLTCYIASLATGTGTDLGYHERHTYINTWPPESHNIALQRHDFKVGSNTFHKGCNPNDYILYCLRLKPQTGEVSLVHAGVNGIYHQTVLSCTFANDALDLTKLNYVHISAGSQNISIRNLVISHAQIPEAHPKFDKSFTNNVQNVEMTDLSEQQHKSSSNDNSKRSSSTDVSSNQNEESSSKSNIVRQTMGSIGGSIGGWLKSVNPFASSDETAMDTTDDSDSQTHLPPCNDSSNCLDQYSNQKSITHNQEYSHPCRFSELCKNINDNPHCVQFIHIKTGASKCLEDNNCKKIIDPFHRYAFRHTGLPDILYPCRQQSQCRDTRFDHRMKYSHGEQISISTARKTSSGKAMSHHVDNFQTTKHTSENSRAGKSFSKTSLNTNANISGQTGSGNTFVNTNFTNTRSNDHSKFSSNKSSILRKRHEQTEEKSSYDWVGNPDEESDEEDSLLSFYNTDAGNSNIKNASSYDQYGNPMGTKFDLGKDGAFKDYSILIGQFYHDSQFNDAAMKVPIDALKVKGFKVKHVSTENECISEFQSDRHQIAWIISTNSIQNSAFTSALTKFHSSGGGIFLFADNVPYICHASEFLKAKFGITLAGDYIGQKTLSYLENGQDKAGHYGQHEIFTGIQNLFEGVTICHPVYSTQESRQKFVNVATATDGQPTIGVYDSPSNSTEGRLALDCGFTKLYVNWDSAGTARYIVNVSCWLLGIEKRVKSKKKKPKM